MEAGDEVRLTGDSLALADNELRKAIQSGADVVAVCDRFITAAIDHVRSLSDASFNIESFNCAVTALLTLEVYKVGRRCMLTSGYGFFFRLSTTLCLLQK